MDEDVTKLTDEELDARIDGTEPEEPDKQEADEPDDQSQDEPQDEPVEEDTEETEEEEQSEEEAPEETKDEERKPPSRRETLRIEQILKKRAEKPAPAPSRPIAEPIDYSESLDADEETVRTLRDDRDNYGRQQYEQGTTASERRVVASEFRTNIRLDLPLVKDRLGKLDPEDVRAIDTEYLQFVGFDESDGFVQHADIGYADYVEARIEQAERLAKRMTAETTKNIAKQTASTGLRPDGSSAKRLNLNKNPQAMTDEELDAVIGQAVR